MNLITIEKMESTVTVIKREKDGFKVVIEMIGNYGVARVENRLGHVTRVEVEKTDGLLEALIKEIEELTKIRFIL